MIYIQYDIYIYNIEGFMIMLLGLVSCSISASDTGHRILFESIYTWGVSLYVNKCAWDLSRVVHTWRTEIS